MTNISVRGECSASCGGLARPPLPPELAVSLAQTGAELHAAQRLRHRVFVDEMGARIGVQGRALEHDRFDALCDHLIVRDRQTGEVIGTYRMLTPEGARRLGAFMSESEFDLRSLVPLRSTLVELGRACVHPDYRSGAVIMRLWSGIARYVEARGFRHLFGCASIAMSGGGANARAVYRQVAQRHLAPERFRVYPRVALPRSAEAAVGAVRIPALLKGYLRLGGWICGEPAWDPAFNTADLVVLLPVERIEARYARHFLRSAADARS